MFAAPVSGAGVGGTTSSFHSTREATAVLGDAHHDSMGVGLRQRDHQLGAAPGRGALVAPHRSIVHEPLELEAVGHPRGRHAGAQAKTPLATERKANGAGWRRDLRQLRRYGGNDADVPGALDARAVRTEHFQSDLLPACILRTGCERPRRLHRHRARPDRPGEA